MRARRATTAAPRLGVGSLIGWCVLSEPTQCTSVAAVYDTAAGFLVGYLQCGEHAGHEEPTHDEPETYPGAGRRGTPHRASLTWGDDDDSVELPRTLPAAIDLEPGTHGDDVEPDPLDALPAGSLAHLVTDALVSEPVPGLCNVEGCVYLEGHPGNSPLHSWWRPGRSLDLGATPSDRAPMYGGSDDDGL